MQAPPAQRRPGREPRRHAWHLTEHVPGIRAQRRPGREPRRHVRLRPINGAGNPAQRRPGREPRRHLHRQRRRRARHAALNEGRGANPGDTPRRRPGRASAGRPLNEGRGANPGDTSSSSAGSPNRPSAQRRPGREPRRHQRIRDAGLDCDDAQRRPGREPRRHPPTIFQAQSQKTGAQRRPGREPRRHLETSSRPAARNRAQRRPGREPRRHSTPTGAIRPTSSSAQRRPGREPRRHPPSAAWRPGTAPSLNEGRGANPGDTRQGVDDEPHHRPLNEGRGANPGDTRSFGVIVFRRFIAQRRPGREPRRHHLAYDGVGPSKLRSTKAGARTPATLARPLESMQQLVRSTKAGARTPATRASHWTLPSLTQGAQRRPGREPRRHHEARHHQVPDAARSTKAGARNPGDTTAGAGAWRMPSGRSTKAGARTPATRGRQSTGAASQLVAQRRPGREPRRHPHDVPRLPDAPALRSTKAGARTPATP